MRYIQYAVERLGQLYGTHIADDVMAQYGFSVHSSKDGVSHFASRVIFSTHAMLSNNSFKIMANNRLSKLFVKVALVNEKRDSIFANQDSTLNAGVVDSETSIVEEDIGLQDDDSGSETTENESILSEDSDEAHGK